MSPVRTRTGRMVRLRSHHILRKLYYNPKSKRKNRSNSSSTAGGKNRSATRIAKMLRWGRGQSSTISGTKNNDDQPALRRSSRTRRLNVNLDYESDADVEDDYHHERPFRSSRLRKSQTKSSQDEHNEENPSALPRREGLRPRRGTQTIRKDYSQDSEEDEPASSSPPSSDNGDEEDDDGAGGGGRGATERAEQEEEEEFEEGEEREGRRRYALRNRTEIRRFSPQMEDSRSIPPKSSSFHFRGGVKRSRDGKRIASSKSDKRYCSSRVDDSDDSLLIDETVQVPGAPFLKAGGSSSFNYQLLFGGLDLSGFSNRSLNMAAATGWGHQSDPWGGGGGGGAATAVGSGVQTTGLTTHKAGADIQPVQIDNSIGFDQVGGLSDYVQALKEMVFFPLLYPKFFENYGITPPRGVLLCGPPGTGKTLVARALAASASRAGQRVNFYMRKGADVLSKWVGEAERQLRMLFEEAQKNQPSIIFFDEIDGLAPVRSSKQEQIHNSIVSTLLALMDGLDSRGQVVIIGATNRVDAIDGALRRPGRFDRELFFSLPDSKAREEILEIHTRKWQDPPTGDVRKELAAACVGYCGADLKALCTEAAIQAFRKKYPQVYNTDEPLLIDVDSVKVKRRDFLEAMSSITPAAQRGTLVQSMPLSRTVSPLLESQLKMIMDILTETFPMNKSEDCLNISADDDDDSFDQLAMFSTLQHGSAFPFVYKPRLLLSGKEGAGLEHLGPAVLHELERFPVHSLSLPCLLSDMGSRTPEEALVNIFREARRTTPAILFLPQLELWWETAHMQLRTVLLMLLAELPPSLPVLLLGTTKVPQDELDEQATSIFLSHIYEVGCPKTDDRAKFFSQLVDTVLVMNEQKGHSKEQQEVFPELPKAPKKERSLTEAELQAQAEEEEHALRRLRMCLREVCNRLLYEKCFSAFHYPVMEDEAPDYISVVKTPMDVATLLQRVDSGHYLTRSAFLQDLELVPINAKEYHGDDYNGARIVSKALALRDAAHGMLSQMDKELVSQCDAIAARGGSLKLHEIAGQMNSALGQSANATRVSARLRGFQPQIDLSQTHEIHYRRTRRNSNEPNMEVLSKEGNPSTSPTVPKASNGDTDAAVEPSKELSKEPYKEPSIERCRFDLNEPGSPIKESFKPAHDLELLPTHVPDHKTEGTQKAEHDAVLSKGIEKAKRRLVKYTKGYEVSELECFHAQVCQAIRRRTGAGDGASVVAILEDFVLNLKSKHHGRKSDSEAV